MAGIKDNDNLEAVRNRLYQRGTADAAHIQHNLSHEKENAPTEWQVQEKSESASNIQSVTDMVADTYEPSFNQATDQFDTVMKKNKRRTYRLKIALLGLVFFGVAVLVSSFFMLFGQNVISGNNISIVATTPFTIGGGEVLPIQISVQNNNNVPIQAATLIIEYPPGTRSVDENPQDLFTERIPIETIRPGETLNMPLRATVFGEENAEKTIHVAIEYRVQGSSARFFKEADPQSFKISSAPVSLRVDGLRRISDGQETSLTLTVVSNALTPLSEVLVKAEYPVGFQFIESDPAPASGMNSWLIENVEPNSTNIITITGVVIGQETDEHVMHFNAGIPNERNKNSFTSIFANASTEFIIEPAFIDMDVTINNSADSVVVADSRSSVNTNIKINNTLRDSLYDLRVTVSFSGNAFVDRGISSTGTGFYDSTTKTLVWDISNVSQLEQLRPGASQSFGFSLLPSVDTEVNPFVDLQVDVYARRVFERQVPEELLGSIKRTVRVNSAPKLISGAMHSNQIFTDSGPVPPKVGQTTTYTLSFRAENGANAIRGARMVGTLPLYVTWLDNMTGDGNFEYNQTNRSVNWIIGDIAENASAEASFQVSLLPSTSQINMAPILFSRQTFQANDTFTGREVQTTFQDITTILPRETGFPSGNGIVQP